MKILELQLLAFGPFSGQTIDLSAGNDGLHVIYGPNEAGKSSALRAVANLLYGFPHQTSDNFLHANNNLRIGAVLQNRAGETLRVVRRKGNKNSLRGADDKTLLSSDALSRFLGQVDQSLFQSMFGIDHHRLRQGGQEIVRGEGKLGELLFSAGSGINSLRNVQQDLQSRIGDLYKSGGSRPQINQQLAALKEKKAELRKLQLSSNEWNEHQKSLQAAEQQLEKLNAAREHKQRERNRLARIKAALTPLRQWNDARRKLESCHNAPLLPEGFAENKQTIIRELAVERSKEESAKKALAPVLEELQNLAVPEDLLAAESLIVQLREDLGTHRTALKDRPKVEQDCEAAEQRARQILAELNPSSSDLSDAASFRLPETMRKKIERLAGQYSGLIQKQRDAQSALEAIKRKIQDGERAVNNIGQPPDPRPLSALLDDLSAQGDREQQLRDLEDEVAQREEDCRVQLNTLRLWEGSLVELESLPVPSTQTIRRFEKEFTEHDQIVRNLAKQRQEKERDLQDRQTKLDQLEREQAVPTEDDLKNARSLRQQGWTLLRDSLQQSDNAPDPVEFLARFPTPSSLVDAYEQSVAAADDIADRLRREAKRVTEKTLLQTQCEALRQQLAGLAEEQQRAHQHAETLQSEWCGQWEKAGITPLPPTEMLTWLDSQTKLAQDSRELRAKRAETESLRHGIERDSAAVREQLALLGSESPAEAETLRELLRRSRQTVKALEDAHAERRRLEDDLKDLRLERQQAADRVQTADREFQEWRSSWGEAMQLLRRKAETEPEEATHLLSLTTELLHKHQEAAGFRKRIEQMESFYQEFCQKARAAAERFAAELADSSEVEIVGALEHQLQEAKRVRERADSLRLRRDEEEGKLRAAVEKVAQLQTELESMCRLAGCSDESGLDEAIRRSEQRRTLEATIHQLEEQLYQHSAGRDLAALQAEVDSAPADPDTLDHAIAELDRELKLLDDQRMDVNRTIQKEEDELKRMDGSAAAALMAEECEQIIAGLEEELSRLAVLKIADAVLRRGIERYREKHQGPIVERASQCFARLTCGSFRGLRPDINDKDQPVLEGIRAETGESISVAGMSDGVCDQLYLALRIASLEDWLSSHEPIPFIVDDVLLTFDDRRAAAALETLAELSDKTQVIFFTHHRHLVDVARDCVPNDRLFVHELPDRLPAAVEKRSV